MYPKTGVGWYATRSIGVTVWKHAYCALLVPSGANPERPTKKEPLFREALFCLILLTA